MLLSELSSPGEAPILAAALVRSETLSAGAPRTTRSLRDLASDSDAVVVFDEPHAQDIGQSLPALWSEIPPGETGFIALVPRRENPRLDPIYCEPIVSFFCSSSVFAQFAALAIDCYAKTLCFAVLRAIVIGDIEVDRLLVREVPLQQPREYRVESTPKALVLPHRGDCRYLRSALKYLDKAAANALTVRVGLDVDECADYSLLPSENPGTEFFRFTPAPVGPYVIRQELAERSPEPLLTLQDSDDVSCYDRFTVLTRALAEMGCGIVGSHELCLDEIRALVQPVRYPLDGTAALSLWPNHALLHATLMTRRDVFFDIGGLSTHHIIANDTQFLLRAYFHTQIRTVDEFLYIRRRHATSLTNAPATIYDNPLRRSLNQEWTTDFRAIQQGELKLEDSSLRPMRRSEVWHVEPFAPQAAGATR